MEIKINYNINDTVYFLAESSVLKGYITEIRICIIPGDIQTKYDVECVIPNKEKKFTGLKTDRLFKTKEDLIASL